ncbi:2-oxo acid dehydrogenase subunit E2 [Urbifossiella limnaea]|uniref:Dihydrolipoamide acetyltransferase component of pyruvate dehydrogenase complex n=1 Tax=Urbifossiella limnaea TaxID=2528023 RepID=A0A517XMG1_9BACT|nr:2-oxo acid dehydrogenase subunit E2 [Urbifossiella limnaea]QDU18695.1 Dihydrolipoyllysine-residue acetyltransferase component of pyruvate dehydrogenase complex [Urbifossiella limnaea]
MDFRLPSLGEGIDSATVTAVLVKPGDAVAAGQSVLSVETDKASMEVEADAAGTVEAVLVKQGDKLAVGAPVFRLAGAGNAPPAAAPSQPLAASRPAPAPPAAKPQAATAPPASTGSSEFRLPNLGEGIEAATVTAVLVKPGDVVKPGTPVASVETDKASMEVEADAAGTVEAVLVKQGDKVPVGAPMLTLTGGAAPSAPKASAPTAAPAAAPSQQPAHAGRSPEPVPHANGTATKSADVVPAGPATRRLARELGVALGELKGTGRGGRVTLDDIKGFVRDERQKVKAAPGGGGAGNLSGKTVADSFTTPPLPDFSKYGEVERKPVAKIRETIAKNLTVAWRTMPMVTQFDLADITDLEAGRKRIVDGLPKGTPKITMTVLAIKAVVAALRDFPTFNSSYDMNAGEVVLKKYFHVGIAVDTERGLVVPVVKDADKKSVRDIAAEVVALADKARAGKLGLDDMRGGTFTITNLGGVGGTAFTPIVNYPEVAILGLSRSALQPVVKDGQIVPRLMMPLSLTYDHRVVDGADGARFTTRLVQLFSDPLRLLMDS